MEEEEVFEQMDFETKRTSCRVGIRKIRHIKARVKARVLYYQRLYTVLYTHFDTVEMRYYMHFHTMEMHYYTCFYTVETCYYTQHRDFFCFH